MNISNFKLDQDDVLDFNDKLDEEKFEVKPTPQEVGYVEEQQEQEDKVETATVPEKVEQVVEEDTEETLEGKTFTPSEIREDREAMAIVRGEMVGVRGLSKDANDDEIFRAWIKHHRGVAGGNSVRVGRQIATASVATDAEKAAMLESARLFERLEGVNSKDYTWGETLTGYYDYARTLILDPVNLVGGVVGKAAGTASTKASTIALRETLKAGWKKHAAKEGAKKTTLDAIEQTIIEGGEAALKGRHKEIYNQAVGQAVRTGTVEQSGEFVKNTAKKATLTALAAGTAADTVTAAGVEYARQQGLVEIGDQEEIDRRAVGLATLGSIAVGSGAAWLTRGAVSAEFTTNAFDVLVKQEKGLARTIANDMAKQIADTEDFSNTLAGALSSTWQRKVARGDLTNTEIVKDVMGTVLLGDTRTGTKGVVTLLHEQGVDLSQPRFKGDNFTNLIIDVVNELPEEEAEMIVDTVRGVLKKKKMKLTDSAGKDINLEDMTIDDLTDIYAANVSAFGSGLGRLGAVAKEVGWAKNKAMDKATTKEAKEAVENFFGVDKLPDDIAELPQPERIRAIQDTLVQTIVSNPGTTALNVKGSTAAMMGTVISDVAETILYGGQGALGFALGKKAMKESGLNHMKARAGALKDLVTNLMRPSATLREFESYGLLRPDAFKEISNHYAGGIAKVDLEEYGISGMDAASRGVIKGLDWYKDQAQKIWLVSAQDRFFKSQMMMYSMSKNIRLEFGEDIGTVMQTKGYKTFSGENWERIEAAVVADVADVTFSRKFGKSFGTTYNPLELAATAIEEARKTKVLGLLMPFGRFFNNTMNFAATYTGVKALSQLAHMGGTMANNAATKGLGKIADDVTEDSVRTMTSNFVKGGVGLGLVATMMEDEDERIDLGLGMFETVNEDGTIEDHTFNYPYNLVLGLSRIGHRAYKTEDGMIPPDEIEAFRNAFSIEALTRTTTDALKETYGVLGQAITNLDPLAVAEAVAKGVAQTVGSAATRPIDPANELVAVINEGGFQNYDKNNWMNQALRYVDQLPLTGALAASAAEGKVTGEPVIKDEAFSDRAQVRTAKFFGSTNFSHNSYTQKVMNHVGKANWKIGEWSATPEINQYVNGLRQQYLEDEMKVLWERKSFKKGELTYRQEEVSKVLSRVDQRVKDKLLLAAEGLNPHAKAKLEFFNKYRNEDQIRRAKEIAKLDKEVEDMTPFELDKIAETIEAMKEGRQ